MQIWLNSENLDTCKSLFSLIFEIVSSIAEKVNYSNIKNFEKVNLLNSHIYSLLGRLVILDCSMKKNIVVRIRSRHCFYTHIEGSKSLI